MGNVAHRESPVNSVRTVSDTKRSFYALHTRPVSSIYRRVVEELMVEMHLLTVNHDFRYEPIYALGVVTTFDRFMQGYRPEADLNSIFTALCQALQGDPQQYRRDAEQMKAAALATTWEALTSLQTTGSLQSAIAQITDNPKFKYSRLFAIGLYTLLETLDPEAVKDADKRKAALEKLASGLNLVHEKLEKDLELYCSNLDKIQQAQLAMADMLAADRKRREQREQEKAAKALGESSSEEPKPESTAEQP
jgi:photosystem II biogenesis protein Psp29